MVKMRDARDTLLALGSLGNVVVTKDDASGIRMKATWQDSRFTLTLTGNTVYVFIQGPSASLLAFGSHVASALDGVLHVAKDVGTDPRNPDVQAGGDPGGDPGSDPDPETSPEVGETVTEEAPGLSPESEQQQHQHTGAEPESEPAFVASGAGSSIVSGQGNVMVNVTLSENTDAPAQVEGLANMLRNLLRLSTGQGREGAA